MVDDDDFGTPSRVALGSMTVHLDRGLATRNDGADILLTEQERRILLCLAGAQGHVIERGALHESVWGAPMPADSRAVDVAIHRLRGKLEPSAARPRFLLTVRGEGYRLLIGTGEPDRGEDNPSRRRLILPTCVVDLEGRTVHRDGKVTELGPSEAAVLAWLAARPGRIVPARELLESVWGERGRDAGRVRTAIQRIRRKIEADPKQPAILLTRSGGFCFLPAGPAPEAPGATNLPTAPNRFFGREGELAELAALMTDEVRLVTLLGVGGCGKTRLAQEFGRRQAGPDWPGGVWFCDLTESRSSTELVSVASAALGLGPGAPAQAEPVAWLGRALAERGRTLIVLDNVEQFTADAAVTIGALLDGAPTLSLLITSREPLGLPAERLVRIEPLPEADALDLLLDRVSASGMGASVDRTGLAEVVRRLDNLPLAVELVAGYAALLSPEQLLARLDRRLGLAAPGGRNHPARHATLRDAMDWSWVMLSPTEARALAQCAVFRGTFTLEDAEAVMDLGSLTPGAGTLEALRCLVDRSLLQHHAPKSRLEEPGFRLFETVREFAGEKLDDLTRRDDLVGSHERWYLELGERLVRDLDGAQPGTVLVRLAQIADNLYDIVRQSRRRPEVAARAGSVLTPLLARQGPTWRLRQVVERAVEAATRSEDPRLLGRALLLRARHGRSWRAAAEQEQDARDAAALASRAGLLDLEAEALLLQADHLIDRGESDAAETLCRRAVALAKAASWRPAEVRGGVRLARVVAVADPGRGIQYAERARAAAEKDRLRLCELEACRALTWLHRAGSRPDQGLAMVERAAEVAELGQLDVWREEGLSDAPTWW